MLGLDLHSPLASASANGGPRYPATKQNLPGMKPFSAFTKAWRNRRPLGEGHWKRRAATTTADKSGLKLVGLIFASVWIAVMLTHDRGGEELCGRRPCAGERSDRQPLGLQKAPAQRGVGSPTSNHRPTKRSGTLRRGDAV